MYSLVLISSLASGLDQRIQQRGNVGQFRGVSHGMSKYDYTRQVMDMSLRTKRGNSVAYDGSNMKKNGGIESSSSDRNDSGIRKKSVTVQDDDVDASSLVQSSTNPVSHSNVIRLSDLSNDQLRDKTFHKRLSSNSNLNNMVAINLGSVSGADISVEYLDYQDQVRHSSQSETAQEPRKAVDTNIESTRVSRSREASAEVRLSRVPPDELSSFIDRTSDQNLVGSRTTTGKGSSKKGTIGARETGDQILHTKEEKQLGFKLSFTPRSSSFTDVSQQDQNEKMGFNVGKAESNERFDVVEGFNKLDVKPFLREDEEQNYIPFETVIEDEESLLQIGSHQDYRGKNMFPFNYLHSNEHFNQMTEHHNQLLNDLTVTVGAKSSRRSGSSSNIDRANPESFLEMDKVAIDGTQSLLETTRQHSKHEYGNHHEHQPSHKHHRHLSHTESKAKRQYSRDASSSTIAIDNGDAAKVISSEKEGTDGTLKKKKKESILEVPAPVVGSAASGIATVAGGAAATLGGAIAKIPGVGNLVGVLAPGLASRLTSVLSPDGNLDADGNPLPIDANGNPLPTNRNVNLADNQLAKFGVKSPFEHLFASKEDEEEMRRKQARDSELKKQEERDELVKTKNLGFFASGQKVVPLSDLRDHTSQHLGTIFVGDNRQAASVIFDTGSTNLWVLSSLCESETCKANDEPMYDISKSGPDARFFDNGGRLEIQFGSGSLAGPQAFDKVEVAHHTITDQPLALIQEERGGVFDSLRYGGIMGLAFESMAATGMRGIMTQAMEENVFRGHNQMTFYFTRNPHIRSGAYFGGLNPALFHETPQCFDVIHEHYWQTGLAGIGLKWGRDAPIEWISDQDLGIDTTIANEIAEGHEEGASTGTTPGDGTSTSDGKKKRTNRNPIGVPKSVIWDTGTTWNAAPTYFTKYILKELRVKGFDSIPCKLVKEAYMMSGVSTSTANHGANHNVKKANRGGSDASSDSRKDKNCSRGADCSKGDANSNDEILSGKEDDILEEGLVSDHTAIPWLVFDFVIFHDKKLPQHGGRPRTPPGVPEEENYFRVIQPPEQWYVGGGGVCKPGIMSIDVPKPYGPNVWILGEIFMRHFMTTYDRGNGATGGSGKDETNDERHDEKAIGGNKKNENSEENLTSDNLQKKADEKKADGFEQKARAKPRVCIAPVNHDPDLSLVPELTSRGVLSKKFDTKGSE